MASHPSNPSSPIDPVKLDKLAEVAIKVGLQLEKGQDLVLTAPVAALPLVRRIAEYAYKAGAGLVYPIFSDEQITLARYGHAPDESFDRAPGWLYEGMAKAFSNNAARLAIAGDNPMLLAAQDPEKVSRANRANSMAYKPALEKITGFDINWNIVSYPSTSWAMQVFPGDDEDIAVGKLADAIFAASRVDAGAALVADLQERAAVLQHAVRRERRLSHRHGPVLCRLLRRRQDAEPRTDRSAGRQPQPDPHRLDDRLGRDRHRRRARRRPPCAGDARGRVGVGRTPSVAVVSLPLQGGIKGGGGRTRYAAAPPTQASPENLAARAAPPSPQRGGRPEPCPT